MELFIFKSYIREMLFTEVSGLSSFKMIFDSANDYWYGGDEDDEAIDCTITGIKLQATDTDY